MWTQKFWPIPKWRTSKHTNADGPKIPISSNTGTVAPVREIEDISCCLNDTNKSHLRVKEIQMDTAGSGEKEVKTHKTFLRNEIIDILISQP